MAHTTVRVAPPRGVAAAASYCTLDLSAAEADFTAPMPITVVGTTAPISLPDEGDPTEQRIVVLGDGSELLVTPSEAEEAYPSLTSRLLAADSPHPCLRPPPADEPVDGWLLFAPESDILGTGFPLRLANQAALPAGTVVDFFALGGLFCSLDGGSPLAEDEWRQAPQPL